MPRNPTPWEVDGFTVFDSYGQEVVATDDQEVAKRIAEAVNAHEQTLIGHAAEAARLAVSPDALEASKP